MRRVHDVRIIGVCPCTVGAEARTAGERSSATGAIRKADRPARRWSIGAVSPDRNTDAGRLASSRSRPGQDRAVRTWFPKTSIATHGLSRTIFADSARMPSARVSRDEALAYCARLTATPLRELQRRHLADAPRAPARVPEHLRLLPLVRRPGRRGRRPRTVARAAGLVARRAAGDVPRRRSGIR